MSRFNLSLIIASSLMREVQRFMKKYDYIEKLNSELLKRNDNFSIIHYCFDPNSFPEIDPNRQQVDHSKKHENLNMQLIVENLKSWFEQKNELPKESFAEFSRRDHSVQLNKQYSSGKDFDSSEVDFFCSLIGLNQNLISHLYKSSPKILLYICEKFVKIKKNLLDIYSSSIDEINQNFELLCGGKGSSFLDNFLSLIELSQKGLLRIEPKEAYTVYKTFDHHCQNQLQIYKNIFGTSFPVSSKVEFFRKNISLFYEDIKKLKEGKPKVKGKKDIREIRQELKNSFSTIVKYAKLEEEKVKSFYELLMKIDSFSDPFSQDDEPRKIRKKIIMYYWETYKNCVLNFFFQKKGVLNLPIAVSMFLKFGYVMEIFLEDDQLSFIYETSQKLDPSVYSYPIFRDVEWLENIYEKKDNTSISELGETFFETVKSHPDLKYMKIKNEKELPPQYSTSKQKLDFEISAMYQPNARLTSGSILNHFPILHKGQIQGLLEKNYISNEFIQKTLDEILDVDYTAFNREIIYKIGEHTEFINQSVNPDLIVIPSLGARISMWQELSVFKGAGSKSTKGRIIIPCFMQEDFKTAFMKAIANFRWELAKSIAGPDWNNVSFSCITSAYTDYVQFYRKNRNLSVEVKEKLAKEFKRARSDKDRFVNDYLVWMTYESVGTQRMNKVSREIFYRYVPFNKEIRENLIKLPAYETINDKMKNIKNKKIIELRNRYKRYIDPQNGKLPDLLKKNLEFYKN